MVVFIIILIGEQIENYIQNKEEIIGDIDYHHEFYSVNLKNERDIIIWLPPSYHLSSKYYPVLYMQDGQNLFDPNTSFTGYDWKVDEIVSGMISNNLIEEIIVVGIYNTKERLEEYNYFTNKGKKYANFLIRELKPFIDENYRTITNPSKTALMGSSMGGLISFQLYWNFPKIFGKSACLSNSFWVNDGEIFNMVEKTENVFNEKNKLYVDCGSNEKELLSDYKKMSMLIKSLNIYENSFLNYLAEGGGHSEYHWAQRLHIPLKFLFG